MLFKKINTLLRARNLDCPVSVIPLHTMRDVQQLQERPIIVALRARGRWGSDRPNYTQQTLLFLCFSPRMRKRPGNSSRQFISLHFCPCRLHTPVNFWPPNRLRLRLPYAQSAGGVKLTIYCPDYQCLTINVTLFIHPEMNPVRLRWNWWRCFTVAREEVISLLVGFKAMCRWAPRLFILAHRRAKPDGAQCVSTNFSH